MDCLPDSFLASLAKMVWPLLRLLLGVSCGLLLANLLEALRWTDYLAKAAAPFARSAHFGQTAASAFALAFISPSAANGLLSEKYASGELAKRELILANLFNGFPAWLAHVPTVFLLLWPVLGGAALIYVGVTLLAAVARTLFTACLGRLLLEKPAPFKRIRYENKGSTASRLAGALQKAIKRFSKRVVRLLAITSLVYILMWFAHISGFFAIFEHWLAAHLDWLAILKPQAMGIIALQLVAEMGATLGAASAALQDASLTGRDIVMAMLVGNVLATPLRAIRHQLPAYAGFFKTKLAIELVTANQGLRAASMIVMIALYALFC